MKPLTTLCLLVLLAFPCFAQRGDAEAYAGTPFMYDSLNNDGREKLTTAFPAFSFGLGYANYGFLGRDNLGFFVTAQYIFPRAFKHQLAAGDIDYDDRLVFFEFQAGLVYRVYEKAALKFPVGLGFHLFYLSGYGTTTPAVMGDIKKTGFGIGGTAAVEYHINPTLYVFFRLQASFDFIGYTERTKFEGVSIGGTFAYYIDGTDYTTALLHIGVTPALGIGINTVQTAICPITVTPTPHGIPHGVKTGCPAQA